MKQMIAIVLVCICVLGIVGCNQQPQQVQEGQQPQQVQGGQLLAEGYVINIDISSLPEGYNYSFSGTDAKAIIDYLSTLNLESNFEENPDVLGGMTWVISLKYENGDALTVYHFGLFIRVNDGSWYKMTLDEAIRFDTLLEELK